MNKALVREPEPDGRGFCPRCGSLGISVEHVTLDAHIRPEFRGKVGDSAWYCAFPRYEAAYFNLYGVVISVEELNSPVYPKDLDAPICACFGLSYDDVAADATEGTPRRIRENLARSQSEEARCEVLAADGRNCISSVQELFIRLRSKNA